MSRLVTAVSLVWFGAIILFWFGAIILFWFGAIILFGFSALLALATGQWGMALFFGAPALLLYVASLHLKR